MRMVQVKIEIVARARTGARTGEFLHPVIIQPPPSPDCTFNKALGR